MSLQRNRSKLRSYDMCLMMWMLAAAAVAIGNRSSHLLLRHLLRSVPLIPRSAALLLC